ncbi:DUF2478 domain-containing protein [Hoeflea prorocentri]|uniref:DUF2478 domain-containing protein n=1 Tax=Hoeflea prorocentri TaxID=1922333 RepID=A0A9X3UGP1_9HYPH|nr:DUF2478 domain-containing protein [Hoeflea prorocentri]MCY6380165.1 DUF2478 domain-containing protein [Hoeflea prorocentri]MDA5397965.1 DUF2478 domain-containing protein [Hoeflea prorocentri]
MSAVPSHMLAAIRFAPEFHVDAVLDETVQSLRGDGLRIAGVVQREKPESNGCCPITFLEDVATGRRLRISQALGSGSRGCRLDPQALADVCGTLIATVESGVDLLVLNRFGKGEADGHGFRSVIEKALDHGVPVLTAVRDTYLTDFGTFAGGMADTLPPRADAAIEWGRIAAGVVHDQDSAA